MLQNISSIIRPVIQQQQNPLQRGFTSHASPLVCATILEEVLREAKDQKQIVYCAYLDAKSAFDVVNHDSLVRKLYTMGVDGKAWTVIRNLHTNTQSRIKWNGQMSSSFSILQGVRQGGLISTDLYKISINDLLDRLQNTRQGARIGTVDCSAPTCADDVTLLCNTPEQLQTMLEVTMDYSNRERYNLQPAKSAVLVVPPSRQGNPDEHVFRMGADRMKTQDRVTHLGMTKDVKSTTAATVDNNIQKARRRLYSLMKPGLHGENGLDPITCLHLVTVYVLLILLYGLEVCLPKGAQLKRLEIFQKKVLKQLLSLPVTTADSAVYILTGILPIEAQLDKKVLAHFGAIARLPSTSTERRIAFRQLRMKNRKSNSWFYQVKHITFKYGLPDPLSILDNPPSAVRWKCTVRKVLNEHWKERIILQAQTYSTLEHLSFSSYKPGTYHPILTTRVGNPRDVTRLHTKLMLATGTYVLQTNRKAFNQNTVNGTCLMCGLGDETKEHFVLECNALEEVRKLPLQSLTNNASLLMDDID